VKTPVVSTVTYPFPFYNHVTEAIYFRKKTFFRPDEHVTIFLFTITEMMTVTVYFKDPHNADKEIRKPTPTKVQPSPVDKDELQLYLTGM
jgi:hypothetical protein